MEMIETTWDETPGKVAFAVDGFDVQVLVTPVTSETSWVDVYDAAGLIERAERPSDQAVDIARRHLFLVWRDDQTDAEGSPLVVAEESVSV
jgi:hypothetical protein